MPCEWVKTKESTILMGNFNGHVVNDAVLWKVLIRQDQGSPNYGPRAKSGPRSHFIRPA